MSEGLRLARTQIFNATNGDRPHAPNVIVFVVYGVPNDSVAVLNEVSIIKDLGIRIVCVGVGTRVSNINMTL